VAELPQWVKSDSYIMKIVEDGRRSNPDFPFIVHGDFNGDSVGPDVAVYATLIVPGAESFTDSKIFVFHGGEQIVHVIEPAFDGIEFAPKQLLKSNWETSRVGMKGDGIKVFAFEKSAAIHYWAGDRYKLFQVSD